MENFILNFFGDNDVHFHFAGLLFNILGCGITLAHYYWVRKKVKAKEGVKVVFSWQYWLADNVKWFVFSIAVSFLFVRFLNISIHLINDKLYDVLGFQLPTTDDHIFYYFISSVVAMVWVHKKYK